MKLSLHAKAVEAFDTRADKLLPQAIRRPVAQKGQRPGIFIPDFHLGMIFNPEDIQHLIRTEANVNGITQCKFLVQNGEEIGLEGDGYRALRVLAEDVQKRPELRLHLSIEAVENEIFEWLTKRVIGESTSVLFDYLLPQFEASIIERYVYVPVFGLSTELVVTLGRTSIRPLNKDFFDQWEAGVSEYGEGIDKEGFRKRIQGFRQKLQGHAACFIRVEAEPTRAREIALEETENSLAMLRTFQGEIFHPNRPSYIRPRGKEDVEQDFVLIGDANSKLPPIWYEGYVGRPEQWILNKEEMDGLASVGLFILNDLYLMEKKTAFQRDVLNSVLTYSRSSLRQNVADRLIYVFTALEGFLLKSENEPIQQNIAERIAFTVSDNREERIMIRKLVLTAYGLRSRAVHHNQSVRDIDVINEFLAYVFKFFVSIIASNKKHESREDFLDEIEQKKFA